MMTDLATGLRYHISGETIIRRHQLLRNFMKEYNVGVLLILYPYEEGYRRWITGVDGTERRSETCFIVPLEGNIYQVIGNRMIEKNERFEPPEEAQPDSEEAFCGVQTMKYFSAAEIGGFLNRSGRKYLGMVHGDNVRAEMKDYLDEQLPDVPCLDVTVQLRKMWTVKSCEEIALIEKAVHLQERVLNGLKGYLRPGMLEIEAVRYARFLADHLGSGGIDHMLSAQIELISWADRYEPGPICYPGRRFTEKDNICITLRLLGDSGYYGTVSRCMSFLPPDMYTQNTWKKLKEAVGGAEECLRPGIPLKKVEEELRCLLPEFPWEKNFNMIHGIGYCVSEAPDASHSPDMMLRENMTVAVELKAWDARGNEMRLGDVYCIEKGSVRCLGCMEKEWILL